MLGIKEYEPKFYRDINGFQSDKKKTLRRIVGQNLRQILWAKDENGEWFEDLPVVLVFEGARIAVCCFNLDELALDEGALRGDEEIFWGELSLKWAEFAAFKECKILGFEILTDELTYEDGGAKWSQQALSGIKFYSKSQEIIIRNGCDENEILLREI